ncbi:MAG: WD40 repeat domain-containing protein, partial [Ktedonobacteraceae bacterium]
MITCFHPTGSSFARGERDGMLSVCQLATSALLWMQEAHTGPISTLAWSPTGLLLASGGRDGMVHVWQAATGTHVCSFSHGRTVKYLNWSPDG